MFHASVLRNKFCIHLLTLLIFTLNSNKFLHQCQQLFTQSFFVLSNFCLPFLLNPNKHLLKYSFRIGPTSLEGIKKIHLKKIFLYFDTKLRFDWHLLLLKRPKGPWARRTFQLSARARRMGAKHPYLLILNITLLLFDKSLLIFN